MRSEVFGSFPTLREKKAKVTRGTVVVFLGLSIILIGSNALRAAQEDPIAAAMQSLDEYMAAFNARDPEAWAKTLNYPHVRIASGAVRIWETEAEYAAYMDFDAFAERFGWDHSEWDAREVVQSGPDKVHFASTFSRYNAEGEKIATFDSLYVVTNVNGHWGTQARSSFAP